jgi:hypothetical protein
MRTDKFVKVNKGNITQDVPLHALANYINHGWKEVEEEQVKKDVTYDNYTKKQLHEIASNRNIYTTTKMNKDELIDLLIAYDSKNANKPSNKGFTDNLIKE